MRVLVLVRATVTFDENDEGHVDDVLVKDCELLNIDPLLHDREISTLTLDDINYLTKIKESLGEYYPGFLKYIQEYCLFDKFDINGVVSLYTLNFVGVYKSLAEFYEILCISSPIDTSLEELKYHGEELFFTHELKDGNVLIIREPFNTRY